MDIVFIMALVVTSLISVTYMVERGIALRWKKVVPPDVKAAVMQFRSVNDIDKIRWTCQAQDSPLSRLLLTSLAHLQWPRDENMDILETRARHEVSRLERGLVVLEIIVGIAPLLGLVGTIYGLILLFGSMGNLDASETNRFAQGISLALYATLLGLVIAIPTLVAWSYFSKKVEMLAVEMETLCDEFLRKSYHGAEEGSGSGGQSVVPVSGAAANAPSRPAAPRPKAAGVRPSRRSAQA